MVIEGNYEAGYFFDRMPIWEATEYLASLEYRNRDSWEQARLISHMTAQVNSKKKLEKTDIAQFAWDEKIELPCTVSDEELKRLEKKAKLLEAKLYG